ncbi:MAG: hypothetical protein ACRDGT_07915 [Candidatus Limnocylindria bacterium]
MGERAQIVLQVVLVVAVLTAAVAGIATSVASQPPGVPGRTIAPPDASLIASTLRSPTATPAPTAPPDPTPSFATLPPPASPTPTLRPIGMQPYTLSGKSYTGVVAPVGAVFIAPFDARVELIVYQLIDGEIRSGTDVAGIPSYPYVILHTGDRIMKFRPGALTTDTQIVVQASRVAEGDPLFRVIGTGPSSWRDFYDSTVGAQIIVSLETSTLTDLDAEPHIRAR